jgi:hypothetical protein
VEYMEKRKHKIVKKNKTKKLIPMKTQHARKERNSPYNG